jgi:hypothetical protein
MLDSSISCKLKFSKGQVHYDLVPRVCLFAGYVVAYPGNEIGSIIG